MALNIDSLATSGELAILLIFYFAILKHIIRIDKILHTINAVALDGVYVVQQRHDHFKSAQPCRVVLVFNNGDVLQSVRLPIYDFPAAYLVIAVSRVYTLDGVIFLVFLYQHTGHWPFTHATIIDNIHPSRVKGVHCYR